MYKIVKNDKVSSHIIQKVTKCTSEVRKQIDRSAIHSISSLSSDSTQLNKRLLITKAYAFLHAYPKTGLKRRLLYALRANCKS